MVAHSTVCHGRHPVVCHGRHPVVSHGRHPVVCHGRHPVVCHGRHPVVCHGRPARGPRITLGCAYEKVEYRQQNVRAPSARRMLRRPAQQALNAAPGAGVARPSRSRLALTGAPGWRRFLVMRIGCESARLAVRAPLVAAAAVVTALALAPGDARSAATSAALAPAAAGPAATPGDPRSAATSPYAPYLVERTDIPGIPFAPTVVPLRASTLRLLYGASTAHWIRAHGFVGGAADAPQFAEPGVRRPDTGLAQAALAAFRTKAAAAGAAARFLAFNVAVSGARHRSPRRLPGVPSARLVVEYGHLTGGTVGHPAAAAAIWTEGRCMLSVSVGGDTARARESYTRYTERVLRRIERRTDGVCPTRHAAPPAGVTPGAPDGPSSPPASDARRRTDALITSRWLS